MAYMTFREGFFSRMANNVRRNVNNMVTAGKNAIAHVTGGIQNAANKVSNAAGTVSNTMTNVANKFGTSPDSNVVKEDTVSGNQPAKPVYNNPQTKGNNSNLISKIKRQIPNGSFQNRTSVSPFNRKVI